MRIVTYNIRTGLGMDGIRSIRRVAQVLLPLSADIICLQEVDQRVPRSWLSNQPKFLSAMLGMQAVFQRNIRLGLGGYGNCILVRSHTSHCRCHPLPGDGEPRGLMEVSTRIDGQDITVFCTHLSTEAPVRIAQAAAVCEAVRGTHHPRILCGDMNDVWGSQTLAALLGDPALRDAAREYDRSPATYPSNGRRIDFVFADLHFDVTSYRVIESDASDHLPVVVDLALG